MVPHRLKDTIKLILIIILIFLISYIINCICSTILIQKQSKLLDNIQQSKNDNKSSNNINDISQQNNFQDAQTTDEKAYNKNVNDTNYNIKKNERMTKIETLQKENEDIKGWIEIEGTAINYPVLQGTDNKFYVDHNYNKEKTKSGAIFIDMVYDWNLPSTNMLIYGHNMKNGTMFTSLMNYKNKKYFEEHPVIRFTTATSDNEYEIISAFESKIYNDSEEVFKYYNFINANNEEEFNNYITNIKKMSIYDTHKTAEYGDELITLSTCAYHTKDGRFVVVAKKIY